MLDVATDILSPNVLNSFGQLQMIPHLTIEFKIKISEQKDGWLMGINETTVRHDLFWKTFFSKNVIFVRNVIRKSAYSDRTYRLSSFPCCILVTDRNLILFIYNLRGAIKKPLKNVIFEKKTSLYHYYTTIRHWCRQQTANCKAKNNKNNSRSKPPSGRLSNYIHLVSVFCSCWVLTLNKLHITQENKESQEDIILFLFRNFFRAKVTH